MASKRPEATGCRGCRSRAWQIGPQVVAMRHRLAHDDRAFADVMVYDTAIDDLPILVKAIRGALGPRPG